MIQIIQEYNKKFWAMVHEYDIYDTNIIRKVRHSFSVADNCFALASFEGLDERQRNLAYLIGLFHDIGRFEQWRLYQTFDDLASVDHGDLSSRIVDNINIEELYLTEQEKNILSQAIKFHTKSYEGADNLIKYYINLIYNADAYSNVITTANGEQIITVEKTGYRQEILEDFINMRPLFKYNCQTKLERCLRLTSCCYNVKLKLLREDIIQKKYLEIIYCAVSKYLDGDEKEIFYDAISQLQKKYLQNCKTSLSY